MATYDETVGSGVIPWDKHADGGFFRLEHTLNTVAAIANHATPTTNTYFTDADILELIDVPAGCIFLYVVLRTITLCGAAATCDLGKAGGQELDAGVALNAAAGTVVVGVVPAGSEDDFYAAADTIDLEILGANLTVANAGSWELSVIGIYGA